MRADSVQSGVQWSVVRWKDTTLCEAASDHTATCDNDQRGTIIAW